MNDLAPNNRFINIIFPSVLLIFFIYLTVDVFEIDKNKLIEGILIYGVIFLLLGIWLLYAFFSSNLYYTEESMIIKSYKSEKSIPLKNIKRLKLTLGEFKIFGMKYLVYRIEYIDNENKPDSVSFMTYMNSTKLNAFINVLGNETLVEQYATTFDN